MAFTLAVSAYYIIESGTQLPKIYQNVLLLLIFDDITKISAHKYFSVYGCLIAGLEYHNVQFTCAPTHGS